MNNGCTINGWNIIATASTNSQFAAVLAGFLFSGIVVAVSRKGSNNIEAVGLFCASIVALGFDSYLFSVIAGENASVCARTWSEGLIASGLLVVGSVGVLDGIGWLVLGHFAESETSRSVGRAIRRLAKTVQVMVHGAIASLALLLALTAWNFVQAIDATPPRWIHLTLLAAALLVSPVAIGLASHRRRSLHQQNLEMPAGITAGPVAPASLGTLAYGLGAPVVVGIFISLPRDWWTLTSSTLLTISLVVGFVISLCLLAAWGLTVPSLTKRIETPSLSDADSARPALDEDERVLIDGMDGRGDSRTAMCVALKTIESTTVSASSTLVGPSVAVSGKIAGDGISRPSTLDAHDEVG